MLNTIFDIIKNCILSNDYSMNYNQMTFLVFLFFFLSIFFLLRNNLAKKIWILIGNIFFCVWSSFGGLFIVLGTCIVTYITSIKIEKIYDQYEKDVEGKELKPKEEVAFLATYKKKAKKYLILAFIFIIGIWIFVKVGKFMGLPVVVLFRDLFTFKGIIVPLGISYYTLSAVGYMLDVYWRKSKPVHSFLDLITVMTYFPHIIQGPISKYSRLLEQFKKIPAYDYERVCHGLQLMLWGLMKKMIFADRVIIYIRTIFGDLGSYKGFEVLLAVLLGGVQLYADFSGCMDIVCGVSGMMGINLDQNFHQPFFARNAAEFWTRWHMTLNAWTKDYIFLPIAMNAKFMKKIRTLKKEKGNRVSSFWNSFVPLISVWIFTGFWHGTGIDYLIWGLYWCLMMTISKETSFVWDVVVEKLHIKRDGKLHMLWQMLRTYLIFVLGKCFTAVDGLKGFVLIFKRMFSGVGLSGIKDGTFFTYGLDKYEWLVLFLFWVIMVVVDILHEKKINIRTTIDKWILPARWLVYLLAILIVVLFGVYGTGFDASKFVYGAF